jgi:hypothetical protein
VGFPRAWTGVSAGCWVGVVEAPATGAGTTPAVGEGSTARVLPCVRDGAGGVGPELAGTGANDGASTACGDGASCTGLGVNCAGGGVVGNSFATGFGTPAGAGPEGSGCPDARAVREGM